MRNAPRSRTAHPENSATLACPSLMRPASWSAPCSLSSASPPRRRCNAICETESGGLPTLLVSLVDEVLGVDFLRRFREVHGLGGLAEIHRVRDGEAVRQLAFGPLALNRNILLK